MCITGVAMVELLVVRQVDVSSSLLGVVNSRRHHRETAASAWLYVAEKQQGKTIRDESKPIR
jgi:hypothetical protein